MPVSRPSPLSFLVLLAGVALVATLPRLEIIDAVVRFEDLERLLRGQKAEQKYSILGPLFATPLFYLGQAFGQPKLWVWAYNRVLLLLSCGVLWWLLRPVLTSAERMRFIIALVLTSMMLHHLMHFGGEVFSSIVMAIGLAAAIVRRAWWGLPLAILGAVNTPGAIGGLGMASLVLFARTRRLRFLLAIPVAAGLVLLENYLRRGDPFSTGYDGEYGNRTVLPFSGQKEFSYPFAFGVLSLLFSFGKGLVFFVPAMFLPLPRSIDRTEVSEADLRWLYRAWIAVVIGLILVYSRWWAWYGGIFWGPRFLLFACFPAALVLARRTAIPEQLSSMANLLTLGVLALSSWVALNGVVYQQTGLEIYFVNDCALEFVVWYVPECSALWWPYANKTPLLFEDPIPLIAIALGFLYLAAPVLMTLGRRLRGHIDEGMSLLRSGPRLRI